MLSALDTGADLVERIARIMAVIGGLLVGAMAILTVVSVTGRALIPIGLGPITGDFELIKMGCAIAAFWFMPYVHLRKGHVTVDLVHSCMPRLMGKACTLLGDLAILSVATVIAWRLWVGLGEKLRYGDTTFILGAPVWIGYAFSMVGAALFVAAGLVVLYRDLKARVPQ